MPVTLIREPEPEPAPERKAHTPSRPGRAWAQVMAEGLPYPPSPRGSRAGVRWGMVPGEERRSDRRVDRQVELRIELALRVARRDHRRARVELAHQPRL